MGFMLLQGMVETEDQLLKKFLDMSWGKKIYRQSSSSTYLDVRRKNCPSDIWAFRSNLVGYLSTTRATVRLSREEIGGMEK